MDVYLGFGGANTIVADARDLLEALGSDGLILLHPCMREALTVLSEASAKDEKKTKEKARPSQGRRWGGRPLARRCEGARY